MNPETAAFRRVGKNLASLSVAEVVTRFTGALLYFFLARYLGPERFGVYSVAVTFLTIFTLFADLGFDSVLIKNIARYPERAADYFGHSLVVKFISGAVCFLGVAIAAWALNYEKSTRTAILLFSATLFIAPAAGAVEALFKGFQRMEYSAMSQVTGKTIVFLSIMALILAGADLETIISVHALTAAAVFTIFYFFVVRRKILPSMMFRLDPSLLAKIFRESFPFFMVGAIYILNARVNIIMLSKMGGMRQVGVFNAANEMIMVLFIIPSIVSTVLFPLLSQQYASSRDQLAKTACYAERILLAIGIPLGMGLFVIAPQVLNLAYGPKYMEGETVFRILAVALSFVFARSIMGWLLAAMDKVKVVMWINLGGLLFNVGLNFILIPKYGCTGAAVTTALSLVLSNVASMIAVSRYLPDLTILRDYVKPAASSAVMVGILYILPPFHVSITIAIGILAYGASFYLMRGFAMGEWEFLLKAVRQRA